MKKKMFFYKSNTMKEKELILSINYNIKKFKESNINLKALKDKNFDEISTLINNHTILKTTKKITQQLYLLSDKKIKLYSKKLLSTFMIILKPNEIFTKISDTEQKLIDASKLLIHDFDEFTVNINKHIIDFENLSISVEKFNTLYEKWRVDNLNDLKKAFSQMYYDLEASKEYIMTKKKMENEVWYKNYEKQQQDIINKLNMISNNTAKQIIENYKPTDVVVFDLEKFQEIVSDQFWIQFKENLEKEPIHYELLYDCLKEIKELLKRLTPSRADLKKHIDEHIDIDLIKQELDHNVFDDSQLFALIDFIIEQILSLESVAENNSTKKWKKAIYKYVEKDYNKSEFLTMVFRDTFTKIKKIYSDLYDFNLLIANR